MKMARFIRKIVRVFIVILILGGITGILKVNETLPEAAKDYSAFAVEKESSSGDVTLRFGDYKISLNRERFDGFVKGAAAIGNAVKDAVIK